MSSNYNVGFRILPGYAFTSSTVGHVILGYSNAHFNIQDNGIYGYINTGYNKSGFQTGLGFQTQVKQNIFIRIDALYTTYANESSRGLGLSPSEPLQIYNNKFKTLAGELALFYQFY